jgi:hypothetical protein
MLFQGVHDSIVHLFPSLLAAVPDEAITVTASNSFPVVEGW